MSDNRQSWPPNRISYCSNVHPGETFDDIRKVITQYVAEVRKMRGLDRMSAGLWLSAAVAESIDSDEQCLTEFGSLLNDNGIDLITLNGFPFGGFHEVSVKEHVYSPAWNEQQRVDYTLQLARILSDNLPDTEHEGTISTVPVAYQNNWSPAKQEAAVHNLCKLVEALHELHQKNGKSIRVCLEMEPNCVLEKTDEVLRFFEADLALMAEQLDINQNLISRHLGVCYDICHQAVMFEDLAESLAKLDNAGIVIGKIQISSAMHIQQPAGTKDLLTDFAEPKYLHQVRTLNDSQELCGSEDLAAALSDQTLPQSNPWRIHFHVPVQSATLQSDRLQTTQHEITKVFDYLAHNRTLHPQLEVETYTWHVLPKQLRPANDSELICGLKHELDWVENELRQLDLLETKQTNHDPEQNNVS